LTIEEIQQIPTFKIDNVKHEDFKGDKDCAVCMGDIEPEEELKLLIC
jgi:hypothetical protein